MSLIEEVRESRQLPDPSAARAIRMAAGVSQQRLADELGVRRNTVSRWEAGERHPSPSLRARYARLLLQLDAAISQAA